MNCLGQLTVDVKILSLVHQRDHLPGSCSNSFESAHTFSAGLLLLRSRVSQEVIQVLSKVVCLWGSPKTGAEAEKKSSVWVHSFSHHTYGGDVDFESFR